MSKTNTANVPETKEQVIKDKRLRTDGYIDQGNDFSNKYLQTYRTSKTVNIIDKNDPESFTIETTQVEDELINLQEERNSYRETTDLYTLLGKQAAGKSVVIADNNRIPLNKGSEILDTSDIPEDATEKRIFMDQLVKETADEVEKRNKTKAEAEQKAKAEAAKNKTGLEAYSKEEIQAYLAAQEKMEKKGDNNGKNSLPNA